MKILVIGSEMVPLAKTGGLGDVLGALPQALAELGNDVRVCLPGYSSIRQNTSSFSQTDLGDLIKIASGSYEYKIGEYTVPQSNAITYLINNERFYSRDGLYVEPATNRDYEDNDIRFAFLCKTAINLVQKLHWQPDIVHVHDWQGAMAAVYLKTVEKQNPFFAKTKVVQTIHNMAYQGKFPKERFGLLGLAEQLIRPMGEFEFFGETNYLKAGISFADKITTVSKTYAVEIQNEFGCGLEGVLKSRAADISGIVNGVDYKVWSPSTDKLIQHRYQTSNLSGKKKNKIDLLNYCGMPVRTETPLLGMITRLVEQKGVQLIIDSAVQVFSKNLQMIILGSGDKKLEQQLQFLESKFPDKLKVFLRFDETLAHRIEAALDIFLMPSQFEPCGLNQMYSLKYGTPPIVHKVGGLADTVVDYNETTGEGTGFVFKQFSTDSMLSAIDRALTLFPKRRKWMKLMKKGMKQDFSWEKAARNYQELFNSLTN